MSKILLATLPDGRLTVTSFARENPTDVDIAQALWGMHADKDDPDDNFDPVLHTLSAIGAGVGNHPAQVGRIADDSILPYHIKGNGDDHHGACLDPNCHDRCYRDACEDDGTNIIINMRKARKIPMACIRICRNAALAETDIPFMRALEEGDVGAQSTIAAKKRALRDIPRTFALTTNARTPEELKALWPEGLAKD